MTYYYEPEGDERAAVNVSEDYDVLVGPNGFMCFLGEVEDRVWWRDGKKVVKELNRLATELAAMRAERKRMIDSMESCCGLCGAEWAKEFATLDGEKEAKDGS